LPLRVPFHGAYKVYHYRPFMSNFPAEGLEVAGASVAIVSNATIFNGGFDLQACAEAQDNASPFRFPLSPSVLLNYITDRLDHILHILIAHPGEQLSATSENLPLTRKKRLHQDFLENERLCGTGSRKAGARRDRACSASARRPGWGWRWVENFRSLSFSALAE
jgi:hypothetical protein